MRSLRHRISDEALSQLPDFHQRVAVLQGRGFLDTERAVQLKVRLKGGGS